MCVLAGLASQQWGRKSGAAESVVSLVDTGGAGALSAHAEKLGGHLLQVVRARVLAINDFCNCILRNLS